MGKTNTLKQAGTSKKKVTKNSKYMISKFTREKVLRSVFWCVVLMRKNRNWETDGAWKTWNFNRHELWLYRELFGNDLKPTEREFLDMSEKEGFQPSLGSDPSAREMDVSGDLHDYFEEEIGFSKVPTNKKTNKTVGG